MLTKICDYINGALEDGDFVIGISIDQSSFFSLIPQDKLHDKFHSWYNIRDDALTVLREYVTGRRVKAKVGEFESEFYPLLVGLAQGSCWSGRSSTLYVPSLFEAAKLYG